MPDIASSASKLFFHLTNDLASAAAKKSENKENKKSKLFKISKESQSLAFLQGIISRKKSSTQNIFDLEYNYYGRSIYLLVPLLCF